MTRSASASDRLIVALDSTDWQPAVALGRQLRDLVRTVKIGSILFTSCGPAAIQRLRAMGFQIMLDLKWFDIPSTVALSCEAAVAQRVSMVTVHAMGGPAMIAAAATSIRTHARRLHVAPPRVLGVTVLTSVAGAGRTRIAGRVMRLAADALRAGCDGLVTSAQEVPALRQRFGARPYLVCPGIRPAGEGADDQRRVCTPGEAIARGADALVVGRPITAATQPRRATQKILADIQGGGAC